MTQAAESQGMIPQDTLFRWGNPAPSMGECCGCRRLPVERFRFNIIVEDAFSRASHTQLLCRSCTSQLLYTLIGQSVETTPQAELNRLDGVALEGAAAA